MMKKWKFKRLLFIVLAAVAISVIGLKATDAAAAEWDGPVKEAGAYLKENGTKTPEELADAIGKITGVKEIRTTNTSLEIRYESGVWQTVLFISKPGSDARLRDQSVPGQIPEPELGVESLFTEKHKKYNVYNKQSRCNGLKNRNILFWAPMSQDWGADEEGILRTILNMEDNLDIHLTVVRNGKANADVLKKMNQYGIVIFSTHGQDGKWLMTGERLNLEKISTKNAKLLKNGQKKIVTLLEPSGRKRDYAGITASWFQKQITKRLPGTLIYNNSCGSMAGNDLWKSLKAKGASVYLGYTGNVRGSFATVSMTCFFGAFIVDHCSVFSSFVPMVDYSYEKEGSRFAAAGQGNLMLSVGSRKKSVKKIMFPKSIMLGANIPLF